jgi:hypothetical protein
MKKMIAATLSGFLALSSFAGTLDVKPKSKLAKGDAYVKITNLENKRVKFEKCISGLEDTGCLNLGKKTSYSLDEIRAQRTQENLEIAYASLADIGVITAASFGGAYVGSLLGMIGNTGIVSGTLGAMGGATIGVVVLDTAAVISIANLNALNPIEQARQAKALNENIITDKDVTIDSTDMNDFIERLDLVLSKI